MVKFNKKIFLSAIIILAIITSVIIYLFKPQGDDFSIEKLLSIISAVISINTLIWGLFCKWLWKSCIFYNWFVLSPDLSGNWNCKLTPNCKEKKSETIPANIKIKQSFFSIQIEIKTEESASVSISASFDIDKELGHQRLIYSFMNTPKMDVRRNSPMHYGSTILEFDGYRVDKMEGQYWTDRETTAIISLERVVVVKSEE